MRSRGAAAVLALALSASAGACANRRGGEPPAPTSAPAAASAVQEERESADASSDVETATAPAALATDAGDGDAGDAGPIDAGASDAAAEVPACPTDGMTRIGRFCIDRYEATLFVVDGDGGASPFEHNLRPEAGVRYEARSIAGVLPQAYISRVEAKAACAVAGKRLCTMREWRRACEGKRGTTYPYGQHARRGRCNSGKDHLLALRYGSDPRRWKYDENFNDPALDAEPGFLARTGEHEGCTAGDEGVFDLVGNLHEWVGDTVDQDFVDRLEAEEVERHDQPWKDGNGVFLGGFFSTTDQHGPGCTFTTIAHEPTYHDYSVGFRCCARANVPEPEGKKRKAGVK
jgi:hypothetical protein